MLNTEFWADCHSFWMVILCLWCTLVSLGCQGCFVLLLFRISICIFVGPRIGETGKEDGIIIGFSR